MVNRDDESHEVIWEMKCRFSALVCLTGMAIILVSAGPAIAEFDGEATQDGIETSVSRTVLDRARTGLDLQSGGPEERVFEYTSVMACQFSVPGGASAEVGCVGAVQACAGNTAEQGLGPQVRLFRRELGPGGVPVGGWQLIGTTCHPDLVPGESGLGMAQILAAFHNTAWAKPEVHVQPEGNLTLVTLPTYFEVIWPAAGFEPGEVDTVSLLGSQVRIRPTVHGYTYVFGDGATTGPTRSPGGPYPDGEITHVYPKAGVYDTRIEITYGGQFSIGGGPWLPIPDIVTVAGPDQPVTVTTARSRLVIR
jgi:hypothetical protein